MKTQFELNLKKRSAFLLAILCAGLLIGQSFARAEDEVEVYEAVDGNAQGQNDDVVVLRERAKPVRTLHPADDGVNVNVNVDADSDSKSVANSKSNSVADADAESDSIAGRSVYVKKTRIHEEGQNNDLLQERLEAIRLRDEQKRTKKILESDALSPSYDSEDALVRRERSRVVVSSVETPEDSDNIYVVRKSGRSSTKIIEDEVRTSGTRVGLSPRFGFANVGGDQYYDVSTRFLLGLGLVVETGDIFGIEMGYSYGEYGVEMNSSNPLVNYAKFNSRSNNETVELHQNLVDLGIRAYLLPQYSTVRPYLSGGGAYSKNFVNYNDQVLAYLDNTGLGGIFGKDYESTAYMGTVGAGLDIGLSKSLSLGLGFKYYYVFSFRDNARLYYPSLYYGGPGAPNISDVEKAAAGSSLGNNNFYTATAGLTFFF